MTDRDMVAAVLHDDWHHCPYHPTRVDECRKYRDALRNADALLPLIREARDLADAESASRVHLANQLIAAERRLAEVEASVREREAAAWERGVIHGETCRGGLTCDPRTANPYIGSEGE